MAHHPDPQPGPDHVRPSSPLPEQYAEAIEVTAAYLRHIAGSGDDPRAICLRAAADTLEGPAAQELADRLDHATYVSIERLAPGQFRVARRRTG